MLTVIGLLTALTAQTGNPPTTPLVAPEGPATTHQAMPDIRYGWQTLVASVSGLALMSVAIAIEERELAYVGFGAYVVSAPIVHLMHGEGWNSLMSFALHLLAPPLGGLGGLLVGHGVCGAGACDGWGTPLLTGIVGASFGALVAIGIDGFLVAKKPAPDSPQLNLALSFDGETTLAGLRLKF